MINIELHSLKSKIARRLFILFLTVILIPSAVTGTASYFQLKNLVSVTNHAELDQASKEYGLSLFNRLVVMQDYLRIILSDLTYSTPINDAEWGIFRERFKGIHIYKNGEYASSLFSSNAPHEIWIEHTKAPQKKLFLQNVSDTYKSVFLIDTHYYGKDLYTAIAELNEALLWPDTELDAYEEICLATTNGETIFCNHKLDKKVVNHVVTHQTNQVIPWVADDQTPMLASSWGLFLDYQFGSDEWIIITSKPESIVLQQLRDFRKAFIPGIALALMLIIFVTLIMIRRHLVPVEALIEGTKAVERNDLTYRVNIDSKDEYAELAASFNAMTDKIYSDTKINETISSLDQQLLFDSTIDDVIYHICKGLDQLAQCSVSYVYIFDKYVQPNKIYYSYEIGSEQFQQQPCNLTEIAKNTQHLEDGTVLHLAHDALAPLLDKQVLDPKLNYSVYSLHHEKRLLGLLVLGHDDSPHHHVRFAEYLYHISVVISAIQRDKKLEYHANYDKLTGLHNRSYFHKSVEIMVRNLRDQNGSGVMMFIDLDRFKMVNDTLGHNIGDLLLVEAASRIQKFMFADAIAARFGGDEFTLFIPNIDLDTANSIALNLIDALSENYFLNTYTANVSASIGISQFPADAEHFNSLLKCADMAMYDAKNTGRERYKFYSGDLSAAIERRNYLEKFLREAIPNGYLEIYYQPKVDIQNGCISGCEALSRFKHPEEGFLSPFDLYNIAEETGTIHVLGDYVLKTAMSQTQIWHDQGIWQGRMAINVSPVQLFESSFYERLIALLEETRVNPNLIELEITEGIFIDNPEKAKQLLKQIRDLGISIAIDDFGTGYSSLAYITQLPIDNLKIDRSFITQMEDGVKYEGILISIIQMAHHLGLKVTAEGIEKVEHLQFLRTHKCQDIQGYLYSKPLAAIEAESLLKAPQIDTLLSALS